MKKLIAIAVIALCTAGIVFTQELTLSGEIKTGLLWYNSETEGRDPVTTTFVHNSEDSNWGNGVGPLQNFPGRFRLNFQVEKGDIGTKFRFETQNWPGGRTNAEIAKINWGYAFAYGYFWDRQIKISAGRMGDSPWGSGGPEMWRELDTAIGMRFEFIPSFIPFIKPGQLNVGFVLNDVNASSEGVSQTGRSDSNLVDILQESVIGLSYTNDYFLLHWAYRLDSMADDDIGDQMLYRVEERIIQKYLPGFQIFANGFFEGINGRVYSDGNVVKVENNVQATNWLYVQYAPDEFTAQLRFGFDPDQTRFRFYTRASFFYNLFNKLLSPGVAFEWARETGPDSHKSPGNPGYLRWYIEPQIRLNFAANTYVALVYRYQDDYSVWNPVTFKESVNTKTHWINLRTVLTF